MKDLAKIRIEWTARAARVAFIAWTLVLPTAARQFQPVPPPAPGRSALPATPMSGQQLLSELRKGGYVIYIRHTSTDQSLSQGWPRSALWPKRDECEERGAANMSILARLATTQARVLASTRRNGKKRGRSSRG